MGDFVGIMGKFLKRVNSFPAALPRIFWKIFGRRNLGVWVPSSSGVFQDENAAIIKRDFRGLPCGALVEPVGSGIAVVRVSLARRQRSLRALAEPVRIWVGWLFPGLVEPIQIRLVVGNPFLDRLPGWFDRLEGFDVEGRPGWRRDVDDALPKTVEAEEKFDLLRASDEAGEFHVCFAARALERIGTPDFENEVTPQGAHGAGALFGRGRDEEDFGGRFNRRGRLFSLTAGTAVLRRRHKARGDRRGQAAAFVGVEAVVADGLLAFGRNVINNGGEEVGGFEDLEVAFGVVMAFGAVDDGLGIHGARRTVK